MGALRLTLSRADESDHDDIVALIDAAADWLRRTKHTDQWAQPWRSEEDRSNRIMRDLTAGKTWMVRQGSIVAGTVTADPEDYPIWPPGWQDDAAVYVRRLVISRNYAGRRLGAALLDWVGLSALQDYGAQWIRIDVWRTNRALHRYYSEQGFMFCGYGTDPEYPSGALFQKRTDQIKEPQALFDEV